MSDALNNGPGGGCCCWYETAVALATNWTDDPATGGWSLSGETGNTTTSTDKLVHDRAGPLFRFMYLLNVQFDTQGDSVLIGFENDDGDRVYVKVWADAVVPNKIWLEGFEYPSGGSETSITSAVSVARLYDDLVIIYDADYGRLAFSGARGTYYALTGYFPNVYQKGDTSLEVGTAFIETGSISGQVDIDIKHHQACICRRCGYTQSGRINRGPCEVEIEITDTNSFGDCPAVTAYQAALGAATIATKQIPGGYRGAFPKLPTGHIEATYCQWGMHEVVSAMYLFWFADLIFNIAAGTTTITLHVLGENSGATLQTAATWAKTIDGRVDARTLNESFDVDDLTYDYPSGCWDNSTATLVAVP